VLRQTEVQDLRLPTLGQEDVGGLDVQYFETSPKLARDTGHAFDVRRKALQSASALRPK
jgi:hypothetical protein